MDGKERYRVSVPPRMADRIEEADVERAKTLLKPIVHTLVRLAETHAQSMPTACGLPSKHAPLRRRLSGF